MHAIAIQLRQGRILGGGIAEQNRGEDEPSRDDGHTKALHTISPKKKGSTGLESGGKNTKQPDVAAANSRLKPEIADEQVPS
ncbi:MAG: hypothetical protein AB7O62_16860 [Pirellulales bacterium]